MLYGFLLTLFVISCFLLALLILIQQGKGSMGLGAMGGGQQILFGGSGGQELFQKITWILGTIFLFGSLTLAIMKSSGTRTTRFLQERAPVQMPLDMPTTPAEDALGGAEQTTPPTQ